MAKKLAPFSALQKAKDYIDSKLNAKVDKVGGKGLSTNDYTTTEKNKLSGIASGAEVNVQSDWNQSTTTADDYIKNKPLSLPASDVYAWAKASTKPSYSASEVGLGNVGNFKAVSTVANQGLSYQEKVNAVANIDALPKWCDQYDGYIKQCRGNGVYNHYKIGTINITSAYVNCPLVLELSGRGIPYTTLQIMYDNSSTTDPPLAFFASNNNNQFYIIKIDTSTWDIFGKYSETWGMVALHRVTGTIPGGIQFTIAMENVSSIPSGATQATYWGNVATAEILRIINQDSSPITSEIVLNNINTYSQKGITYHGVGIANYNIMPNIPANGFILTIPWAYDGRSGTYFRQFFVDDDHNTPICVRYYSGENFGAWKALAYTDDIPTTYAGSSTAGGIADAAYTISHIDTRTNNSPPSHYISNISHRIIYEFKYRHVIDAPGTAMFGNLITITPWGDNSGGMPVQLYINSDGTRAMRNGISETDWSSWIKFIDEANIDSYLNTKVDKVSGKGLSTNDYTTTEKNKLAGIASGAEVNVQPDWNQSTTTADDYIKNKPSSMPASDVYAWAKASTKPSYSASEVGAIATTARGAVNGVASLGSDGKVPSSQLPESGGIQEITLWENADPSQNQAETSIANPLVATPAGMKMLRVYYVTKYSSDNKSNKVKDLPLVPVGWSGDRMWVRSSIIDWGNCTDSYHNTNRYNCVLGRDIMYYASSVVPDTYPNGFIKIGGGYYASMDVAYNPQSYPSMTGDFADAMIVTKITALVY